MVETVVSGLLVDLTNQTVILLKEVTGDHVLPIWIGKMETNAIVYELSRHRPERPLAHDLLSTVIRSLGAEVSRVLVSCFIDGTYYAELSLRMGDRRIMKLDARPSDVICLALKFRLPIYVARHVMETYGVIYRRQDGAPLSSGEVLREYIAQIDPEDFGNYRLT